MHPRLYLYLGTYPSYTNNSPISKRANSKKRPSSLETPSYGFYMIIQSNNGSGMVHHVSQSLLIQRSPMPILPTTLIYRNLILLHINQTAFPRSPRLFLSCPWRKPGRITCAASAAASTGWIIRSLVV
jgi:hypothetical protein